MTVMITGKSEYPSLSEALENSQDGDSILFGRTPAIEDVDIELPDFLVFLEGGWSCDFGNRTDTTSILVGSMTLLDGEIVLDRLTLDGFLKIFNGTLIVDSFTIK